MVDCKDIELKAGDILHCTSTRWLSRMIQKFTKSRINHSALVIELWGELYVIDSQKDGTNPRKLVDWQNKYNYTYRISRPIEGVFNMKDIHIRALSKSGDTPYDIKSLLWYQPIYQLTGKWKGKTGPDAEGRMYCSEFVSWVYGFPKWWELSPGELFNELNQAQYLFRLIN